MAGVGMTAAKYRAGLVLEHATRHDLEADGYYVIRSAGSKGAADLVAIKPGELLLVQCKLDGKMTPLERHDLSVLADRLGVVSLVAYWRKDGRAARKVAFRYRTPGIVGPPEWKREWTPDYAIGTVQIRAARMTINGPTRQQVDEWKQKGLIGR